MTEKIVKKTKEPKQVYYTYEDFDKDKLLLYAGLDCIVTSELLAKIFPKIAEEPSYMKVDLDGNVTKSTIPSILSVVEGIEMKAHEYILDLEINGIKYDLDANRYFLWKLTKEIEELESKIREKVPISVNLDSGKDVAEFLYVAQGLEPPFKTKSGEPATDGAALLTLAGIDLSSFKYSSSDPEKQYLADMAKRKDLESIKNTFVETYPQRFVRRDGRIHPSYNLHGTSSFRITGDNPNLTQLPRPKHGYNLRECYTVDEGNFMLLLDFSSAEVKILGALCKDPTMLQAIEEGRDFHSSSASAMIGVPYQDYMGVLADKTHEKHKFYKMTRQSAKALTFGILYGSSVNGIAMNLNVSKEEAERLIALYFKTYPGIEKYVNSSHSMAKLNQQVVTPFGQRKQQYGTFSCFRPTAAYNAALRNSQNVIIQSTTSTLGLITFSECNEGIKKLGGKSICTVYDSAEFEVPISRAAECIETAFYYFDDWPVKNFDFLTLPIGSECEIGLSWGDAVQVHRGVTQEEVEGILYGLASAKEEAWIKRREEMGIDEIQK